MKRDGSGHGYHLSLTWRLGARYENKSKQFPLTVNIGLNMAAQLFCRRKRRTQVAQATTARGAID